MTNYQGIGEKSAVLLVNSIEDADDIIKAFEEGTTSKFVTSKQKKTFGKEMDPLQLNSRILWEDMANRKAEGYRLKFDGMPFMLVGEKVMDCQHGVDRHVASKAKYKIKRESDELFGCKRRRNVTQESKKLGCLAKIRLRELLKFPKYKISTDTKVNRIESSRNLRQDLSSKPKDVTFERRIYVNLPADSDHCNHIIGEASGPQQRLDKSIVGFIHSQVTTGIKTVRDMKVLVKEFVRSNLFNGRPVPPVTNRRYHPTDQDIRNHMYLARLKVKDNEHQEDVLDSLVNLSAMVPGGVILIPNTSPSTMNPALPMMGVSSENSLTADLSLCSKTDLTDESEDNQACEDGDSKEEPEDTDSCMTVDERDVAEAPVVVHLQVEPEVTKAMAKDCQHLLRRIHQQTSRIQDPDTLHQTHAILRQLSTHLDAKIMENNGGLATHHNEKENCVVYASVRMSALERELKKTNKVKKIKRSLIPSAGPDFSDSDYEVHCETLSPDVDTDVDEDEVKAIVQESV